MEGSNSSNAMATRGSLNTECNVTDNCSLRGDTGTGGGRTEKESHNDRNQRDRVAIAVTASERASTECIFDDSEMHDDDFDGHNDYDDFCLGGRTGGGARTGKGSHSDGNKSGSGIYSSKHMRIRENRPASKGIARASEVVCRKNIL
jgi:hypothetical protein